MKYAQYITVDSKIMAGKPVITGTRIPVDIILKKLAKNMDVKEILQEYPRLKKEAIAAVLWYAGEVVNHEEVYPLSA